MGTYSFYGLYQVVLAFRKKNILQGLQFYFLFSTFAQILIHNL